MHPDPAPRRPDAPTAGRWTRALLCAACLLGLLTVAVGALAAHLPEARLAPGGRELLRTAVRMQGWHVPALFACGLLLERRDGRWPVALLRLAGSAFLAGIACFCAALYTLASLGDATPFLVARLAPSGGFVLMLGWILLAIACLLPAPGRAGTTG